MKSANSFALLLCLAAVSGVLSVPAVASEAERDAYLLELVEYLQAEQWSEAYPLFDKIDAITAAENLESDDGLLYYHGEVAFQLGKFLEASSYFGRYLVATEEQGRYAAPALDYMAEISRQMEITGAGNTAEDREQKEDALLWLMDNLRGNEIALCINPDTGSIDEWRLGTIDRVTRISNCSFRLEGEYSRTIDLSTVTISLADKRDGTMAVVWDPHPEICKSNAITAVSSDTKEYERRLNAYKDRYCVR